LQTTLVCTVGYPRSGKTTWARKFARAHGCPHINLDTIRLEVFGHKFFGSAEPYVQATAKAMVRTLFGVGHPLVVYDATSVTRNLRQGLRELHKGRTLFHHVDTPAEECLRRCAGEFDPTLPPVIERMASIFEPLGEDEDRYRPVAMETAALMALGGPQEGSLWKHYKGGHYCVVTMALQEGSKQPVVVYRAADGSVPHWARPLSEWQEEVEPGVPRFVRVKP
jgi:predicted kinase